jgi:purine-cytosine permease-like protein
MTLFETVGLLAVLFFSLLGLAAFGYCAYVGAQKLRRDLAAGQREIAGGFQKLLGAGTE